MRSVRRLALLLIAALACLHWWDNTLQPEYVGPAVWNLVIAGAFWAAVVGAAVEVGRILRQTVSRTRPAAE